MHLYLCIKQQEDDQQDESSDPIPTEPDEDDWEPEWPPTIEPGDEVIG